MPNFAHAKGVEMPDKINKFNAMKKSKIIIAAVFTFMIMTVIQSCKTCPRYRHSVVPDTVEQPGEAIAINSLHLVIRGAS